MVACMDKVWIELPVPRDDAHGHEIAKKANRMLARLRGPFHNPATENQFMWDPVRKQWGLGSIMGFATLGDNGEWFNLDYLGRE